jgi:hypothetical protein
VTVVTVPAPPDQSEWWDVAATKAVVLSRLRLAEIDVDTARIDELIPTAGRMINDYLDSPDPLVANAAMATALEELVVALYMPRATELDYRTGRVTLSDPLRGVIPLLRSSKQRWGVA